ncbi:RrF2 family transcriptional regulator [Patescibacteria group bacterium]
MFKINRATEYAMLLLVSLLTDKSNKPLPLSYIAKTKNLPLKYLEQIALKLKEKKLIKSKQGSGGGYLLTSEVNKISLKKIIEAVEGKKGLVSCIHGECKLESNCLHKKVWLNLQQILEKELEKITLLDLVK